MDIVIKTGQAEDNVKALRLEMKNLKSELLGLEQGSEEYNRVLTELANKTRDLNDINKAIRNSAADLGQKLNNLSQLGTGIAGGFAAAQGAVALFGSSSETLQKTMVKLQAAIALVNGLKGLEGLTKTIPALAGNFRGAAVATKGFITSLKGMKAAIASTGIGLLVIAIGELIAHWDDLMGMINNLGPWENLKGEIDAATARIDALAKKEAYEIKLKLVWIDDPVGKASAEMDSLRTVWQEAEKTYNDMKKRLDKKEDDKFLFFGGASKAEEEALEKLKEQMDSAAEAYRESQKNYQQVVASEGKKASDAISNGLDEQVKLSQSAVKREQVALEERKKQRAEELDSVRLAVKNGNQTYKFFLEKQKEVNEANILDEKNTANKIASIRKNAAKSGVKTADDYKKDIEKVFSDIASEEEKAYVGTLDARGNLDYSYQKEINKLNDLKKALMDITDYKKAGTTPEAVAESIGKIDEAIKNLTKTHGDAAAKMDSDNLEKNLSKAIKEAERVANMATMQFKLGNDSTDYGAFWDALFGGEDETKFAALEDSIKGKAKELMFNVNNEVTKLQANNAALNTALEGEKDTDKRAELEAQLNENNNLILLKQQELNDGLKGLYDEDAKAKEEAEKTKKQAGLATAQAGLSAVSNALGAVMDFYDENSEEYKNMQIAQTVINTISGAAMAYAQAMELGPVAGPIVGAVNAAAVTASGIAAIAKIKKGGDSVSNSSTSTASIPSTTAAQPYTYTRNLQSSEEQDALNQPMKVYVLESDITDAQNTVKAKVSETSF